MAENDTTQVPFIAWNSTRDLNFYAGAACQVERSWSMSTVRTDNIGVTLSYYDGADDPVNGIFVRRPVGPEHTDELWFGVYADDDSVGIPECLRDKALQIEFSGTPRALAAFGAYLLALANLESDDPDVHEHFEEVKHEGGDTVHLIVRRRQSAE